MSQRAKSLLLQKLLLSYFGVDEKKNLVYELGEHIFFKDLPDPIPPERVNNSIAWEDLPGTTDAAKLREFFVIVERKNLMLEVEEWIRRERPNLNPDLGLLESDDTTSLEIEALPRLEYATFEVTLIKVDPPRYKVLVTETAGSRYRPIADTTIDLGVEPLKDGLAALRNYYYGSSAARHLKPTTMPDGASEVDGDTELVLKKVEALGQHLMGCIFAGDIEGEFRELIKNTDVRTSAVRLRLRLEVDGLGQLPWECLYDTWDEDFLANNAAVTIARYMELKQAPQDSSPLTTVNMLYILSSPQHAAPLQLGQEYLTIEKQLKRKLGDNLRIQTLVEPKRKELFESLSQAYHIVHFSGHSLLATAEDSKRFKGVKNGKGYIQLSETDLIDEDTFMQLFKGRPNIRLVVLNSCESARSPEDNVLNGLAPRLVRNARIPSVIAMQYPIYDHAAITFADSFYAFLADKHPIEYALSQARKALYIEGDKLGYTFAWMIPVLYMQVRDSRLFA